MCVPQILFLGTLVQIVGLTLRVDRGSRYVDPDPVVWKSFYFYDWNICESEKLSFVCVKLETCNSGKPPTYPVIGSLILYVKVLKFRCRFDKKVPCF